MRKVEKGGLGGVKENEMLRKRGEMEDGDRGRRKELEEMVRVRKGVESVRGGGRKGEGGW